MQPLIQKIRNPDIGVGLRVFKRKNKYGAKQSEYAGRSFHSQGERDCYFLLLLMQKANEIRDIECQVTTKLTAGLTHKTDFKIFDLRINESVWVEYKGMEDQRWRDIKKLWRYYGPGRLRVYKGSGLRIRMVEEIIPEPSLQL